jgi:hypothetical protein
VLDARLGVRLRRQLRRDLLEFGVAQHRQHGRQRQCAALRDRQRQRLGAAVVFAVLGGQQQAREGAGHGVSAPR